MSKFVIKNGEKMRCGYTTGACAAAAAKAAAEALLTKKRVKKVELITPNDTLLTINIEKCVLKAQAAVCSVIKDSGDDPDVTDGTAVCARVSLKGKEIEILGGEGVGIVTKKGLDQPVGAAAINSVPRRMITKALVETAERLNYGGGFRVEIFVPNGAEIAEKTYNPYMGIEGGISIIGTTGVVEPMSSKALVDTIKLEMKMRREEGLKDILLTPGNIGEDFLREKMPFAREKSVKCSNYIGEAIDAAIGYGFESLLIVGHIGKLVKLGAGIMNTHSAEADGRADVLVTCGVLAGVDDNILKKIPDCATVDAMLEILGGSAENVMEILARRAQFYLDKKVKNSIKIGAIMFNKSGILVRTARADEIKKLIAEEKNG